MPTEAMVSLYKNNDHIRHITNEKPTSFQFWLYVQQFLELFRQKPKTEPISQHSVWRADLLAKRVSKFGWNSIAPKPWEGTYSDPELVLAHPEGPSALYADAIHHAWECLIGRIETCFTYELNADGLFGDGYAETLPEIGSHYTQLLAKEKRQLSRAELETQAMVYSELWARQYADTSEVLIWTSYPGLKQFGYHGSTCLETGNFSTQEKHHSFFYVMWAEKGVSQDGSPVIFLHTHQLRCWPNLEQARSLQHQLVAALQSQTELMWDTRTPDQSLIENLITSRQPDTSVAEKIELIKQILYADTEEWQLSPDTLPQLDLTEFWSEQSRLFKDFYLIAAAHLFQRLPQGISKNDSYWIDDPEYHQILQQLDKAFSYYVGSLELWVEQHNTNPAFQNRQSPIDRLKHAISHPLATLVSYMTRPTLVQEHIDLPKLERAYAIDVKSSILKQNLTAAERSWFFHNVSNVVSLSTNFLSLAQCGIMTPFTLPFTLMKRSISGDGLQQFSLAVETAGISFRQELLQNLQEYQEINLGTFSYMVPLEYYKEYLEGSYVKDGVAVGPCDIPLDDDPLVFQKAAFLEYLTHLEKMNHVQQFDELENELNSHLQSDAEQQRLQVLLASLKRSIFKESVTLSDVLTNDLTQPTVSRAPNLQVIVLEVRRSLNPLRTFEQIAQQLLKTHNAPPN